MNSWLVVHDVVPVIFRFGVATDGDDGTLNSGRAALASGLLDRIVFAFVTGLNDRRFVLGTDIASIDQELDVVVDADEHAARAMSAGSKIWGRVSKASTAASISPSGWSTSFGSLLAS